MDPEVIGNGVDGNGGGGNGDGGNADGGNGNGGGGAGGGGAAGARESWSKGIATACGGEISMGGNAGYTKDVWHTYLRMS